MIFLLERFNYIGYDEYGAKIVRATSETEAREIANETVGDEGAIWTDKTEVLCTVVSEQGESVEILGSFNAG